MIKGQRKNLVGGEPGAIFVHDAKPVGIAIQPEAKLGLAATHEFADLSHAFGIGFRVMSTKERIQFIVKHRHARAGLAKQAIQIVAARSIHQLYRDL